MAIKFSKEKRGDIVPLIQQYFAEERDERIGNLEAEFLLDFFIAQIGPHIYNQALQDAQAYLRGRLANIEDGLHELEQYPPR